MWTLSFTQRFVAAMVIFAISTGLSWAADQSTALSINHIDLKPIKEGFYDATVGLVMTDPKLGKQGKVSFDIVIAQVHDADEAVTKAHDPVKTLSSDLQRGYFDMHREQ